MIYPKSIDHLVFRVSDMERTERFYSTLLGQPLKEDGYVMYMAGDTRLFFTCSVESRRGGAYVKEKAGLNHLAFGVRTRAELQTIQTQLGASGISNSGIKFWQDGVTEYIWLDDPDGMRIEFWLRPE